MSELVEVLDKEALAQAVSEATLRIVSVANPQTVLLFGSAVRGEMTPDSDLDFLGCRNYRTGINRKTSLPRTYRFLHPSRFEIVI